MNGLIKGTTVQVDTCTYTQSESTKPKVRVYDSPFRASVYAHQTPFDITWKWENSITCISYQGLVLKCTPGVVFFVNGGRPVNAGNLQVGDVLEGPESSCYIEDLKSYKVLSPVFMYRFPSPVIFAAKGVYVQSTDN